MGMRKNEFGKYVSLSILGMLGSSGTILADTFFVSNRLGADGLAALNLSIAVFGLINGLGMLFGIGGATRYTIFRSQGTGREPTGSLLPPSSAPWPPDCASSVPVSSGRSPSPGRWGRKVTFSLCVPPI